MGPWRTTLLWDLYARCYDLLEDLYPYRYLQDQAVSRLRLISNLVILDVGCGTGNTIQRILNPKSRPWRTQVVGIDPSPSMLIRAREKLATLEGATLLEGDVDVALVAMDRIIAINSLYAVPQPERTIQTWYRLLEDGGILVVANPFRPKLWSIFREHFRTAWQKRDWLSFAKFFFAMPGWLLLVTVNIAIAHAAKQKHLHFLSPEALGVLLRDAGFHILTQEVLYGDTVVLISAQKESGAMVRRAQTPEEIEQTYALRYQVYCQEMQSLDPKAYPDKKEHDRFDPYAIHFIARSPEALLGCIRLLPDYGEGFLLEEEFLLPEELAQVREDTLELSRLIVAPAMRGSRLWYLLVEAAVKWGMQRGYRHWILACQERLWLGLQKNGWGVQTWEGYQLYHHTSSAPGVIYPPFSVTPPTSNI